MVLSVGSTGDVEPFVALSVRLRERGHEVWLAADAGFEGLAPGKGVEFTPIRADFQSLLPTAEGARLRTAFCSGPRERDSWPH